MDQTSPSPTRPDLSTCKKTVCVEVEERFSRARGNPYSAARPESEKFCATASPSPVNEPLRRTGRMNENRWPERGRIGRLRQTGGKRLPYCTVLYHSSTVPPGSGFPRVPPVAASLGHNSRGKKTVKGITLIQSTGASPDPWVSRLVVAGDRSAD